MSEHTVENDRAEMVRLLEPHWRTDCSHADTHAYVRWVKCRCGWESRRSSSLVSAPDLHRIWIKHLVDVLTRVLRSAHHAPSARCDQRRPAMTDTWPPDRCPRCGCAWHGLPCRRTNPDGTPCRCETAWEER